MATNGISSGEQLTATAPSGGVTSGKLEKVGDMWGVPAASADENDKFALILVGEYELDADTSAGSGASQGKKAFVIPASGLVTADDGGGANDELGWFTEDSADADAKAKVALVQKPA